jgi:hypothetical protein
LALAAASTLLADAPEKLTRRLASIAFEDVGLADMEICQQVAVACAMPGAPSWDTVSVLVPRLTKAEKCRASDDLLMSADSLPICRPVWREYFDLPVERLADILSLPGDLHCRAIALRYLLGTQRGPERKSLARPGSPKAAFEGLLRAGVSTSTLETVKLGYRITGSALPPLVALLSTQVRDEETSIRDDRVPSAPSYEGVPVWAYDIFSREGRRAIAAFLSANVRTSAWVKRYIQPEQRMQFLGGLFFRVEGQRCRKRFRWEVGDRLRLAMDFDCHGPDAYELLGMAEAELPLLHEMRLQHSVGMQRPLQGGLL